MTNCFLLGGEITLVLELFFSSHTGAWLFLWYSPGFLFQPRSCVFTKQKSSLCISVDSNLEMDTRLIKKSCFAKIGYIRVHTGQCKCTGGCYNELVVAFFSTGGGVKGKKIYTC